MLSLRFNNVCSLYIINLGKSVDNQVEDSYLPICAEVKSNRTSKLMYKGILLVFRQRQGCEWILKICSVNSTGKQVKLGK